MHEHISGTYTIKQIFEDDNHWERFQGEHPNLRPAILNEVEKMRRCKDPSRSGYHIYSCPDHPEERIVVPHTCKSRFCTSCRKIKTDQWIENAMSEFLDVPYHHIVFTMPDKLWDIFLWDRRLLNILFLAAELTILEWCRERGGYVPGVVCVLHTFGSILNFNIHIHMLITEGGLSPGRTSWIPNEFIPWNMLQERWRQWIVKLLRPELERLIRERRIGNPYRSLGIGSLFRAFLGSLLPVSLVRAHGWGSPCLTLGLRHRISDGTPRDRQSRNPGSRNTTGTRLRLNIRTNGRESSNGRYSPFSTSSGSSFDISPRKDFG